MLPSDLHVLFRKAGISFYTGVPDSILAPYINYLEANEPRNAIAVNEGSAVALGIGHYLATASMSLVYFQNSGLGNALDPLTSVADKSVMGTPMILLIGWRGEPGVRDEPQHEQLGAITPKLLELLGIKHQVLDAEFALAQIFEATKIASSTDSPFAILVEPGTFKPYNSKKAQNDGLSREDAVKLIADQLKPTDVIIATNGKIGRELFEHRHRTGTSHERDLLVVGGMGHASSIALQIAVERPKLRVFCLDGDGSVLMHLGSLAHIASAGPGNLYHIVLNNHSHESTGGQSTLPVDLAAVAKSVGYNTVLKADAESLERALEGSNEGPTFIEVEVTKSSRPELMRPTISPSDNKDDFMAFIKEASG